MNRVGTDGKGILYDGPLIHYLPKGWNAVWNCWWGIHSNLELNKQELTDWREIPRILRFRWFRPSCRDAQLCVSTEAKTKIARLYVLSIFAPPKPVQMTAKRLPAPWFLFSIKTASIRLSTRWPVGVEFVPRAARNANHWELGYKVTPCRVKPPVIPSIFGGRVKDIAPSSVLWYFYIAGKCWKISRKIQYSRDWFVIVVISIQETVAKGGSEEDIIEKIDIGGISLIRAAAKNFQDTLIVSSREQYDETLFPIGRSWWSNNFTQDHAFCRDMSMWRHYDSAIFNYFQSKVIVQASVQDGESLRYGKKPAARNVLRQTQWRVWKNWTAKICRITTGWCGYAINLVQEFDETAFVIIKHTNACRGSKLRFICKGRYQKAFQADTISAFGACWLSNKK